MVYFNISIRYFHWWMLEILYSGLEADMLNNGIPDQVKKLFIVQSHKVILVTIISTIVTMLERIEVKEWYCSYWHSCIIFDGYRIKQFSYCQ